MRTLARFVLVLLLLTASACSRSDAEDDAATTTLAFGEGPTLVLLEVEIADTPDERATGLMGRESLPEDRGMAFLFDGPTESAFWMKNTLIPLSIAFWDEADAIVAILEMEPCEAEPCPRYDPGVPYVGAVEANAGWFERNGVKVGEQIELRSD
jgi:uncharacterized membrane protein (UPF0127 family)